MAATLSFSLNDLLAILLRDSPASIFQEAVDARHAVENCIAFAYNRGGLLLTA